MFFCQSIFSEQMLLQVPFSICNISKQHLQTCWHLFACKQFWFRLSTPFNKRAASCVTEGTASTCHFAVDHTWQSQLRSGCLAGPAPADTGIEGGGAGREEWQHRCIIHLFIIPRFSPLIIRKPTKTSLPSLFLSLQMSSVGAWLRRWRQERTYFSAWI